MTTEEFVPAIERVVRDGAVSSALDAADRRMVAEVIKEAADFAVFGFPCVLDGVSAMVDAEENGSLALRFVKTQSVLLNPPDGEMLHALF